MKCGDKVVILTDQFEYGDLKQGAQAVIASGESEGLWWIRVPSGEQMPMYSNEFEVLDD
jgi:hypothetical protein